ncbi:type II toxin-antitoxin system toxin DhiT [Vibrio neonatus]|uniref:type II toxin-antitoxin system toxin DhiT n=1 Tax=Vibrio neonatus TaxID=278860 RepID=UPI0021C25509|nr:DUF4160 domain-containing protein [Vibrio neonatus]
MPEILRKLLGLRFAMYLLDDGAHNRPHIHVRYGEHQASIAIDDIELLAGYLPPKKLKTAEKYILEHQAALLIAWNGAIQGTSIRRVN